MCQQQHSEMCIMRVCDIFEIEEHNRFWQPIGENIDQIYSVPIEIFLKDKDDVDCAENW